jgi:hypothetical protein
MQTGHRKRMVWIFVLGLATGALLQSAEPAELWVVGGIRHPAGKDQRLDWTYSNKWSEDARGHYETYLDASLTRTLDPRWALTTSLRFQREKSSALVWRDEIRPAVAATYTHRLPGNWRVAVRQRFEYRILDHGRDDFWRSRSRVVLTAPAWENGWQPYVSEEVFHDHGTGRINQNRLFLGLQGPLAEKWNAAVHAGWRSNLRAAGWRHTPVVNLAITRRL